MKRFGDSYESAWDVVGIYPTPRYIMYVHQIIILSEERCIIWQREPLVELNFAARDVCCDVVVRPKAVVRFDEQQFKIECTAACVAALNSLHPLMAARTQQEQQRRELLRCCEEAMLLFECMTPSRN